MSPPDVDGTPHHSPPETNGPPNQTWTLEDLLLQRDLQLAREQSHVRELQLRLEATNRLLYERHALAEMPPPKPDQGRLSAAQAEQIDGRLQELMAAQERDRALIDQLTRENEEYSELVEAGELDDLFNEHDRVATAFNDGSRDLSFLQDTNPSKDQNPQIAPPAAVNDGDSVPTHSSVGIAGYRREVIRLRVKVDELQQRLREKRPASQQPAIFLKQQYDESQTIIDRLLSELLLMDQKLENCQSKTAPQL